MLCYAAEHDSTLVSMFNLVEQMLMSLFHLIFRYLSEVLFKKPVILYNYPKDIKAFYMRLNDDGRTVAAMDVLVPKVLFLSLLLASPKTFFCWIMKHHFSIELYY